ANTNTAFVEGDLFGSDAIVILHHGDGSVTVSDELGNTRDFTDVNRLVVNTHWGDDAVRYKLDGTLTRDMDIDVDLADGNDRFTGTLNADISSYDSLNVAVNGGGGNDLLTMYGTPTAPARANDFLTDGLAINEGGLGVGWGAQLNIEFDGGDGNDRIFVDYRGELDGFLMIDADGGGGDDTVSAIARMTANSIGQVGRLGNPSAVRGGTGIDALTFHVFDISGNNRPVLAQIDGGEDWWLPYETDRGSRTGNVAHAGGVEDLDTV
ncbi:MAG TPA: hypothetical protein VM597_30345, partial [Gemmataceae bacterium]|nr:hypothetical protein [Gemmataceae bacterium]